MKKGFTLIELMAVIAILSLLSLIIIPNVVKMYNRSILKTMERQEENIVDASNLYINDKCKYKISSNSICPQSYISEYTRNNDTISYKYICLNDIQTSGYINEVKYKGDTCKGVVEFTKNSNNKYLIAKTYLYCGTDSNYSYKTEGAPNYNTYSQCN